MSPPPENLPAVYPGDIEQQKPLRCHGSCLHTLLAISVCPAVLAGIIFLFALNCLSTGLPLVSVENAYLTRFDLTTGPNPSGSTDYTLDYDLKVEFGLLNKYRDQTCYRDVEAVAYYGDSQRLSPAPLQDFCLSSKTSRNASMSFAGRTLLELDPVGAIGDEKKAGSFLMMVTLKWTYGSTEVDHRCSLVVPLVGNRTSPAKFSRVACNDVTPPLTSQYD